MYRHIYFAIVVIFIALLAYWSRNSYSDVQHFKFKSYGDVNNPVIVLIPGLDGATSFYSDTIPELSANFHVVQYFLPLKTKNMAQDMYTFDYMAEDLLNVIDSLHIESAVFVGESFGGVVAQTFAARSPQKVASLILLSSLAKTDLPPEIEFKVKWLLPIVSNLGEFFPGFAQFLFAQIHSDDVVEKTEPLFVRELFIKEATFAHFYSVMARIKIVYKLNIVENTKTIKSPTLIIYGKDDHFTRKDSLSLHELIAGSQIKSLPGGHLPHITSPKEFASMISNFAQENFTKK